MTHPILLTLGLNHTNEREIWDKGIGREGYNGDSDEYVYLCYRYADGRVDRVTIVENIYLSMAKQTKLFSFRFMAVRKEHAKRMANEAIIKLQTGQHLYGCMTRRQAIRRMRVYFPKYSLKELERDIQGYNDATLQQEHLYYYGDRCYVSKAIIDELIDIEKFKEKYEQR